jgi:hypothetical protein
MYELFLDRHKTSIHNFFYCFIEKKEIKK